MKCHPSKQRCHGMFHMKKLGCPRYDEGCYNGREVLNVIVLVQKLQQRFATHSSINPKVNIHSITNTISITFLQDVCSFEDTFPIRVKLVRSILHNLIILQIVVLESGKLKFTILICSTPNHFPKKRIIAKSGRSKTQTAHTFRLD